MAAGTPAHDHVEEAVVDLAGFDLLTDASRQELEQLAVLMVPETAGAGAVLIRRGATADRFLLVTAGVVQVLVPAGPDAKTYRAAAGSLLGEIAFLRGGHHSATVTAVTDLRALAGNEEALARLLATTGVRDRLLTRARQRLAAGLTPVRVSLIDGTPMGLRPVHPDDGARFLEAAAQVSRQTVFRRFFTMAPPSAETAKLLTQLDYVDHFAWAAVDEHGVPVGGATYVRTPSDVTTAEISFSIVDEFQGRGLGKLLMAAIAVAARRNGIVRFTAEVLEDNLPMRAILARGGMVWEGAEDGVVHGTGPVPDPARFGMDEAAAAALDGLVDATALGAWHTLERR